MNLPNPEDVRINDPRISARENRAINWELVDVFLRAIKDAGALTLLGKRLCISRAALAKRRRDLKLKKLPTGRKPIVELTPYEREIYNAVRRGSSMSMLAVKYNVSYGAISSIYNRVVDKLESQLASGCKECGGLGIVACKSCIPGLGPHHHVCLDCGGNSTTWASGGM